MKNIILFDDPVVRENLLPLSFTRPLADFRVGITTIRSKWEMVVRGVYSYKTVDYLQEKYPMKEGDVNLYIAGNICPDYSDEFKTLIDGLSAGEAVFDADDTLIAACCSASVFESGDFAKIVRYDGNLLKINMLFDVFMNNGDAIRNDYKMLDFAESQSLSETCTLIGPEKGEDGRPMVYIAPGASVEGVFINTTHGPVFIGPDATVMEGSCLRGPVAVCRHATVNMGTKVYGDTTIGPWSKVGGELNNAVIFGYSNKAHDGFLGNAVLGEWCNLGAGCVASNLKNDYTRIKLWNYPSHRFLKTDLQFCGLIMGDHSKAGINTMFNTATVVGVGCNIHGSGFPRTFIPSFSEGGFTGMSDVSLAKFFEIAARVMARRGKALTDVDRTLFEAINRIAETYK